MSTELEPLFADGTLLLTIVDSATRDPRELLAAT
jgi:hypothetical protein